MEVHIVLHALSPLVPAHDTIMILCSFLLLQKALILYELLVCVLPPTLKEEAVSVVKQREYSHLHLHSGETHHSRSYLIVPTLKSNGKEPAEMHSGERRPQLLSHHLIQHQAWDDQVSEGIPTTDQAIHIALFQKSTGVSPLPLQSVPDQIRSAND